jgi:transcriptional regulator
MRQNPSFAMSDVGEIRRLIEQNPWVTLVSATEAGLVASHYAVMLDPDRDDLTIVGHVGKPDDLIHGLGDRELLVVVQGPHGYISPGWYGDTQSVPTWNFISAHLRGIPELLTAEEMWEPPHDPEFVRRLEKGTAGFRLTPTRVVGKRKLSQNKPDEVVETVIVGLESAAHPYADPRLAGEMRRDVETRKAAR